MKIKKKKEPNKTHLLLEKHLFELGIGYEREFRFHHERRWRFDYLLDIPNVAIEIEGGIWLGKGHTGGKHFQSDLDKYNHAALMGYRVLRFSTQDVAHGRAKAFLEVHFRELWNREEKTNGVTTRSAERASEGEGGGLRQPGQR